MSRLLLLSLAGLLACSDVPTTSDLPFVQGTITHRRASGFFVDGGGDCTTKATLWIDSHTRVLRRAGQYIVPADTGDLVTGRRVAVWVDGVVLESCPPQAGASRVLLESDP